MSARPRETKYDRCLELTLLRIGIEALARRGNVPRLYRRGRNPDRTVRENLLTGSIRDIDTPRHTLDIYRLMLRRALLVRCRMFLLAARPFCGFSGLIMTQMPNIALYTAGAGPFLHELRLVSRHILLVRDRVDTDFAGNG